MEKGIISRELALNIILNGTYYYPVSKHYPYQNNPIINCSYCGKKKLSVSIGYENYDLCGTCIENIANYRLLISPMSISLKLPPIKNK